MKATSLSRYTPSLMKAETLEAIFVQRHGLAEHIVELIRESALTPSKHYTLLIGPRGIGKTHFVSLVYHRICLMDDLRDRILIAWLREEEWGVTSFLDLLLRIFRALQEEYNDIELAKKVESLYSSPETAESKAVVMLREFIGERTLLLLVENLDELFAGLEDKGQKKLRSFLQESSCCTILATAQSLFNGVKLQTSPFYGFFRIRYLKDLNAEEAAQLLTNLAKLNGDRELESFIQTPTGRDRIQAVHHLAGGNHRIYVIFSDFLTRESLDELVDPFMRTLDDLTPYYQARMAWLSPQQRKIVEFLVDSRHAVTVKEIAQRCFITHQTTSSQLKDLREKGYVSSEAIGRESFYELREVLMRFCLEVKKQRGEPIRLFVDFLRIWYTKEELQQRWESCLASSQDSSTLQGTSLNSSLRLEDSHRYQQSSPLSLEQEYLRRALEATDTQEDPRVAAYIEQLLVCYEKKDFLQGLRLTEKLVEIKGQASDWLLQGAYLNELKRYEEAIASYDRALAINPDDHGVWNIRGIALFNLGQFEEAIASYDRALAINPDDHGVWNIRGIALFNLGQFEEAIASYDRAIELGFNYSGVFFNRAIVILGFDRWDEGMTALENAIKQIQNKEEVSADDTELIIGILFKNTQDSVVWKSRLTPLIQLYDKYEILLPLGQGLVKSISTIMPETVSNKTAQTWLELWRELTSEYQEFQLPLRLLNTAVEYKEKKGDRRVLLGLAMEERQLLEQVIKIEL